MYTGSSYHIRGTTAPNAESPKHFFVGDLPENMVVINNNTLYLYSKSQKYELCSVVLTTLKHYEK